MAIEYILTAPRLSAIGAYAWATLGIISFIPYQLPSTCMASREAMMVTGVVDTMLEASGIGLMADTCS